MPITERALIKDYGASATAGMAVAFVGAGLSRSSGYPDWNDLMRKPRTEAGIPEDITDLPLVAEYFVHNVAGGRDALDMHVLTELGKIEPVPGVGHKLLARLPIDDFWTTNYDCLIETAAPWLSVLYQEDDLRNRRSGRRRLVKMHGSTDAKSGSWIARPVLTRADYEGYEQQHPRTWAALRAAYLTRAFMFLGFSFADPNIELLLRLARTLGELTAPEHFTVLRRPVGAEDQRAHHLRVQDLERSGIAVCEIDNYDALVPLLRKLVRRTRDPYVFVSGSDSGDSDLSLAKSVGSRLAELPDLRLCSLAGPAGLQVSFGFGDARSDFSNYRARDIEFHFRRKNSATPSLSQRTGTAINTGIADAEQLRREVLDEARVCLLLGGGSNTDREVELALELGIPLVPLPTTGGAARRAYQRLDLSSAFGSDDTSDEDKASWNLLASENRDTVVSAAYRLVRSAAYLAG